MADLHYEYKEDGINRIIEERGNFFTAVRLVKWREGSDYKLDIRKYSSNEEGDVPLKGVSFMTEEAPSELITCLLEEGYGNTVDVANSIFAHRQDIVDRIIKLNNSEIDIEDDESGDTYYDAREMVI